MEETEKVYSSSLYVYPNLGILYIVVLWLIDDLSSDVLLLTISHSAELTMSHPHSYVRVGLCHGLIGK